MLDFNTSPQNDAGNFLFGDMSLASKTRYNLQQAAAVGSDLALDPSAIRVVKDANGNDTVPAIVNPDSNYWNKVANSPEYAKALYEAHIKTSDPSAIGQPMTVRMKDPNTGILSVAQIENTGVVRLRQFAPDEVRQMEADVQNQKANKDHVDAVKILNDSVTKGISVLETASAANTKAVNDVVKSVTDYGTKARPILDDQAKVLSNLSDNIIAAGNIRAGIVADQRAALAQPEISAKADKILNASLDFVLKSNIDRDKAKAQLDEVMANPFYRGASVVYGGDDKNPIIASAKTTFDTAQDAAVKSQQIANSVMTGIDQYQKILEKQYLVKTPEEVVADAAKFASDVKKEANKAKLESLGTTVTEASAAAKATETIFGDKYKILHEKISGLTALVQATSGVEKQALQVQLMEMNRQLKIMEMEGKDYRAELTRMGMNTPEGTKLAKDWATLNGADPEDARVVAAMAKQGKTNNDKDFQALDDLRNPRLPAGMRLAAAEQLFLARKDISKIAPGLELTVDRTQNGYKKYIQVAGITEQAANALRAAKGDKYSPATDNKEILAGVQKALVASIENPEDPLVIKVEGKDLTLKASSPGKVFPGEFIPLAGTATDSAKDSPLPEPIFNRLKESKLAQRMATAEIDYRRMPVGGDGEKNTIGYKDAFVIGRKLRESDPSYTLDQFASELRDIYQAGIYLNNKYLNPTLIGLPEQKDYVIKIEKQSVGKTIMGTLSAGLSTTFAGARRAESGGPDIKNILTKVDELSAVPGGAGMGLVSGAVGTIISPTGAARKSATGLSFRLGEQNAFSSLRQTEEIDLTNPTKIKLYQTQLDAKLWADRKVAE